MNKCLIYTDCKYALFFICGKWTPCKNFIKDIVEKIEIELENLYSKDVEITAFHTKTKNIKRVDKKALEARKKAESKTQAQIQKRIEKVENAITKGHDYKINRNGNYYAMPKSNGFPPGYKVNLDPLSCGCHWWKYNWGNKTKTIVNARALPCKHICALAEHLNQNIFDIFDHQINNIR